MSYGVYIRKLIRFARGSDNVNDLNEPKKLLTAKLLNKSVGIISIVKHGINVYNVTIMSA